MKEESPIAESIIELTDSPIMLQDSFGKSIPTGAAIGLEKFQPFVNDYPTVYILYSEKGQRPEAYVGETTHLKNRINAHSKNEKRNPLTRMIAIGCETFNQSATYNIESNLINYLLADQKFRLQNKSQITDNFTIHNYYQKKFYNEVLFSQIWDQLKDIGLVDYPLHVIRNRDIFKLSPYKQLSSSQANLVNTVITFCEKHINDDAPSVFLIKGEAGTGKSVVLSCLYKALEDLSNENSSPLHKCKNYLLVNHSEQLKTYEKIAKGVKGFRASGFKKPTSFINAAKKEAISADITIVDEAHLLLSQKDAYNSFTESNHLEEIMRHSKITIIVYDDKQVLKLKSYWDENRLKDILSPANTVEEYQLVEQFRMNAAPETQQWINAFVDEQKVLPFSVTSEGKDSQGFEFKVFCNADDMYAAIKKRNAKESLCRVIATFDYEHKKDGAEYFVEEGTFRLPWNTTEGDSTWAERPETINEVGSIYTIQGFDLNYAGVILGPSVSYDETTNKVIVRPEKYKDTEAFRGRSDLNSEQTAEAKMKVILNSVNVLMKRGMKGLYLYASDEALREVLVREFEASQAG